MKDAHRYPKYIFLEVTITSSNVKIRKSAFPETKINRTDNDQVYSGDRVYSDNDYYSQNNFMSDSY